MKKLSAILAALLLVLSLTGCSGEPLPTTIPAEAEVTTVPATVPETEPTVPETQPPAISTFSVHFIDVGQADAALVQCDGHYMLIDGGNRADSDRIYAVLKRAGVPVLELVVGTHAHEDHIGGIPGAFSYTTARKTLCPVTSYDSRAFENFTRYSEKYGGGITGPAPGDTYPLGSALVTILGLNSGSSTNDSSIVLRIDYGRTSFLFTGDAEFDAEKSLLNAGADLSATVLKVGHHGSETSTGYTFLREIMPRYAVISCGTGNSYGHPDEAVLSRLRDAEVQVFRTDLQGDIFCTSDGESVTFEVSKNAEIDTLGLPGVRETDPPEPEKTEASSGNRYILNTNSKKFHEPDCSSVRQMSEQNKQEVVATREELIAQGYVPCKRCKP